MVHLAWRALLAGPLLLACPLAHAVIVSSGNGNTDAASLLAAGGPGDPSLPGFANVGSTGTASAVYLQNRWAITANHVSLGSSVSFGGVPYTIDPTTIVQLVNADGVTPTDLKLFRLTTDPGLPAITSSFLSSSTPSGRQILIGNGLNAGTPDFWHVDPSVSPWVWTEQSPPATPGPDDYAGYDLTGSHIIRWGENNVLNTGVNVITMNNTTFGYDVQFDKQGYTLGTPLASEAQGTSGDSGGAAFTLSGGQWNLAGIMFSVSGVFSGQPSSTAIFGDRTLMVDLTKYRTQILAIVPEPSGLALAALAAVGLALAGCRRRSGRRL